MGSVAVAVLVSAGVGTVGIASWVCRAIRQIGILPSRTLRDAKKVGRTICLHRTPVQSHYVIFSKKGEWGRGEINPKRLVVYLHGLAGHAGHLMLGVDGGLARSLVDADYSVLGLDIHGHGFSEAPDCSMERAAFVDQLVALLAHLGVTDPFDLIGFSHGCVIALAYAAKYPSSVKRLALTSPFGCWLPLHTWRIAAAFYAFVVHLTFEENRSHMRTVYRVIMSLDARNLPSLLDKIKSADIDVLVVAGSYEWIAPLNILTTARQITDAVPKSRLELLPRASHMSWATGAPEQQKQFRRMIVDFLESSSTMESFECSTACSSGSSSPHVALKSKKFDES